jgi:hypothetical protein
VPNSPDQRPPAASHTIVRQNPFVAADGISGRAHIFWHTRHHTPTPDDRKRTKLRTEILGDPITPNLFETTAMSGVRVSPAGALARQFLMTEMSANAAHQRWSHPVILDGKLNRQKHG